MQTQTTKETQSKTVKPHYYQSRALQSKKRFIALIAGTGGGKTFLGPIWLYQELSKYPEDQFFVIAPVYKMLTRATVPMLIDMLRGTDAEGEYNQSKGLYLLPQGGRIWFGSADRPETLEAGQYRAAWLDEAGQMKYMVWVVMQARLGLHRGRALITTTPYSLNWLYTEFYKRWRDGDPDYEVIQFESISNPHYPKEEFERAKGALSPQLFDMRYKGQFRKMEGLVYPDFSQEHMDDGFEIPEEWKRQGGTDFGFNNPHVNLKGAVDADDVLYIYEEWYKPKVLLSDHAEEMKDIAYAADPSGKREIVELQDLGVKIDSAVSDVNLGIQKVNERIKTNRLKVFKACKNLIDEFEVYHWEESKDKPHKENDHCLDALRYLVMELERGKGEPGWVYHAGMAKEEAETKAEEDKQEKPAEKPDEVKKEKEDKQATEPKKEEESDDDSWVVT